MLLRGYLSRYDGKELTIIAPFAGAQLLERQGITECEVLYKPIGRMVY